VRPESSALNFELRESSTLNPKPKNPKPRASVKDSNQKQEAEKRLSDAEAENLFLHQSLDLQTSTIQELQKKVIRRGVLVFRVWALGFSARRRGVLVFRVWALGFSARRRRLSSTCQEKVTSARVSSPSCLGSMFRRFRARFSTPFPSNLKNSLLYSLTIVFPLARSALLNQFRSIQVKFTPKITVKRDVTNSALLNQFRSRSSRG
jgi:hypothetical protein